MKRLLLQGAVGGVGAVALAVIAQMTYAPAPPGNPWVFSPSAADPNGPTPVCLKSVSPPPDYNCYGGEAINAIIRAQSPEYLRAEAAKLAPLPTIDKKRLSPA